MKTTIDISDQLYRTVKRFGIKKQMNFRQIVEAALREFIKTDSAGEKNFALEDASVDGDGLNPEFQLLGWNGIRDEIYRGHGS